MSGNTYASTGQRTAAAAMPAKPAPKPKHPKATKAKGVVNSYPQMGQGYSR